MVDIDEEGPVAGGGGEALGEIRCGDNDAPLENRAGQGCDDLYLEGLTLFVRVKKAVADLLCHGVGGRILVDDGWDGTGIGETLEAPPRVGAASKGKGLPLGQVRRVDAEYSRALGAVEIEARGVFAGQSSKRDDGDVVEFTWVEAESFPSGSRTRVVVDRERRLTDEGEASGS